MILCGLLETPGGPQVVHVDHVENHWFNYDFKRVYAG